MGCAATAGVRCFVLLQQRPQWICCPLRSRAPLSHDGLHPNATWAATHGGTLAFGGCRCRRRLAWEEQACWIRSTAFEFGYTSFGRLDARHDGPASAMGVHGREWLANCGTPALFANCIDNRAEAQEHILDQVPAVNDDRSQRAAVVAMWRGQASEASGRSCKLAWARCHNSVGSASDPTDSGHGSAHLPTACGGAPCFGVLDQRSSVRTHATIRKTHEVYDSQHACSLHVWP